MKSSSSQSISRRHFLRGTGVTLGLPLLECFAPRGRAAQSVKPIRRMVAICTPLGLHTPHLYPKETGRGYALTPYLEPLAEFKNDFSVISGLSHPDVGSSHDSIYSFLTAAPHPEVRAGFRNSISLDQFAAEKIGGLTRVPSLSLSAEGFGLSWTRSGALVPPDMWPASVFARLFLEGRPDEVEAQTRRLRNGKSILDTVGEQAKRLAPTMGARDREKVDEYFTSVRELERRMVTAQEWALKPKPKVDAKPMQNNMNSTDLLGKTKLLFDLTHLALETDSTRLVNMLLLGTSGVPVVPGVTMGHHDLSHHGQDPAKIEQLAKVELGVMNLVHDLLAKLKKTQEEGGTLLDRTMVFFSSNLGSAASHSTRDLPVIFAGGGFKHGQHLAFDSKTGPPLSNLYVTMLQRLGIEADKFGSSTGTLTGLDLAG